MTSEPILLENHWVNGDEKRANQAGKARATDSILSIRQITSPSEIPIIEPLRLYLISRCIVNFNAFYHRPTVKLSADPNNGQKTDKRVIFDDKLKLN